MEIISIIIILFQGNVSIILSDSLHGKVRFTTVPFKGSVREKRKGV